MDFDFSPDQRTWHDSALAFARAELADDLIGRDRRGEFWRDGWRRCALFGVQGLPVPVEFGGRGQDLAVTIAALEGLGRGCADNGLIVALNACLWTVALPLVRYGTDDQKRLWLPGLCDGTLVGANGASEAEAGSDIFSMRTRAERRGGGWAFDGRKTWCTSGPVADLFVVYASTDPTKGSLGISAFLLPRDTPGLRVVREIDKMGLRTAPMGELAFEDCLLSGDALLGREGRGAEVFHASMQWERAAILAAALGTMRRQLDRCIEHARRREQFGQSIGRFQAVSHRIVDMKLRLETCRLLVHKVGWLLAQGRDATAEAAMAKLHVSECFVQNGLDAVRVFGASGYATETGLERDLRDGIGGLIYSGTSDIQREIIARALKL